MSRRNNRGRQVSNRGGRGGNTRGGNVRTDRIGSTLREIIADELARLDDEVGYVTVTDVEVDNELTRARVFLSTLDLSDDDIEGVREHTGRIKKAIGQRARIRRVPELEFMIDPGLLAGTRVSEILSGMDDDRAFAGDPSEEE
ncbi:MAG: 30S ribosome-binding factor RbfA [Actinomycetota bacterium]